jgi:Zn finger protein HypA/HybF involved in hydrogenase expression
VRGAPHHHSPSVISSAEMTAIAHDIVETTEDEPCGESEGTPSDENPVFAGKVAAIGTCHKCGGSLRRGRKEIASLCKTCGTRFHSIDCGNRLQISGYPGMSEHCPKVRRVLTSRHLSTGSPLRLRCLFFSFRVHRVHRNTLSRGCARVLRRVRPLEARIPHNCLPAQRARPPCPSAEPLPVSPHTEKYLARTFVALSRHTFRPNTHVPHHLPHLAVLRLVHVCRR